jgi:hypothetical protein
MIRQECQLHIIEIEFKGSVWLHAVSGDADTFGTFVVRNPITKPLQFTPHMADPDLLTAEGEEVLRSKINKRIGGM